MEILQNQPRLIHSDLLKTPQAKAFKVYFIVFIVKDKNVVGAHFGFQIQLP